MPAKDHLGTLTLLFDSVGAQKMQNTASNFVSDFDNGQEFSIFHCAQWTLLVINYTFVNILLKSNNLKNK